MRRSLAFVTLVVLSSCPFAAVASFQMFCEIEGEVVSAPVRTESVEFDFFIAKSRDIEIDVIGTGEPLCDRMVGRKIGVSLAPEDAGNQEQIVVGARLTLQRYEMDVIRKATGDVVRSIKHVRVTK